MTAASKRTGASSVGFFNNCLADDLGSMSTVPFGCLLLSLPIRAAHGVPFWRGFLGIHFKSMYIDFLSSHRNCVQLSQLAVAYATASLLPPCPRSPFSSFSFFVSSDFREQTMAACAAGIPFVSWAETTRDFRSRTGLFRPHQEVLGVPSLAIFPDISGHGKSVTSRGLLRGRWRWRGAGRRDEKWRI